MTPEELKKHMLSNKLSVMAVSRDLCVTERAVYLWIKGDREMPLIAEKLFCLLYGIRFNKNKRFKHSEENLPPYLFDIDNY